MYAEDAGLLHEGRVEDPAIFTRILKRAGDDPDKAKDRIAQLFTAMQNDRGQYGDDDIACFNGGLFKTTATADLAAWREQWLNPEGWLDWLQTGEEHAAAYGWAGYTPAMPDEAILRRLLALNLERTKSDKAAAKEAETEETT